jgi:hypothetical protein
MEPQQRSIDPKAAATTADPRVDSRSLLSHGAPPEDQMLDVQQQGTPSGAADACTEAVATSAAEVVTTGEETDAGADDSSRGERRQLELPRLLLQRRIPLPQSFQPRILQLQWILERIAVSIVGAFSQSGCSFRSRKRRGYHQSDPTNWLLQSVRPTVGIASTTSALDFSVFKTREGEPIQQYTSVKSAASTKGSRFIFATR